MPLHHDVITFTAGDDWVISGELRGADGVLFDTSGFNIFWELVSPDGKDLDVYLISTITVESIGNINIFLPASYTKDLHPGRYSDALRLDDNNNVATFWIGQIIVNADPFSV